MILVVTMNEDKNEDKYEYTIKCPAVIDRPHPFLEGEWSKRGMDVELRSAGSYSELIRILEYHGWGDQLYQLVRILDGFQRDGERVVDNEIIEATIALTRIDHAMLADWTLNVASQLRPIRRRLRLLDSWPHQALNRMIDRLIGDEWGMNGYDANGHHHSPSASELAVRLVTTRMIVLPAISDSVWTVLDDQYALARLNGDELIMGAVDRAMRIGADIAMLGEKHGGEIVLSDDMIVRPPVTYMDMLESSRAMDAMIGGK